MLFNPFASWDQELDNRCVKVLKRIITATEDEAQIVFNSTHRLMLQPENGKAGPGLIPQMWAAGFRDNIHPSIHTCYPEADRLTAIDEWLNIHGSHDWVALDDEPIEHERAYAVDPVLGIGVREFNHCAKWFGFKPFLAL